ncbi:MAG: hypothetical protein K2N27_01265 [Ruminococcus sp.]|nr:hypothetical protein [Ruminococcus sp.]
MKKELFYELIGGIDEETVRTAENPPVRKKHMWLKYTVSLVACTALIIGIGFSLKNRGEHLIEYSTIDTSEENIALEHDNINIYYVNNNELISVSEYLPCSPDEVFRAWKKANNIGNEVELIKVEIKSNGTESSDSFTASYTVGDRFIMEVTVTENLKNYYSAVPEDELLESLRLSLTGYNNISFDEYYINFE